MRRKALALLAALISLSAFTQTADSPEAAFAKRYGLGGTGAQTPWVHPYRKVGDKIYDLRPLYSWLDSVKQRHVSSEEAGRLAINRPMRDWFGLTEPFDGVWVVEYRVAQVLHDGLLVQSHRYTPYKGTVIDDPFVLTNYPGYTSLTDNQKIRFLALRVGSYQYSDTMGAIRTVPLYDYGIPVNPQELNATINPPLTPEQQATRAQSEQAHRTAGQLAALKFYQSKAEAGDGFAQLRLGEIYFRGQGVETNLPLARHWLSMALANGYPQATNLLHEIELGPRPGQ
jgi:hypothetical protein